jgi:hypothetical protein
MGKGVSVGGIVKNDAGEPVEGATVKFGAGDHTSHSGRRGEQSFSDEYVTDKEGRWVCSIAPAKMDYGSIQANHPDYAQCRIHWSVDDEIDALRSKSLVVYVHKGLRLRGRVTDAEGKPVPGAVVMQGDSHDPYAGPFYETDAEGRFAIPRASFSWVAVVKPGFAPVKRDLGSLDLSNPFKPSEIPTDIDEISIQLERAARVAFKVTDAAGQPIPGAWIVQSLRGGSDFLGPLCRRANPNPETDENGIWIWESAPKGREVYYDVLKSGYMEIRDLRRTAFEDAVFDVTLKRPQVVKGRVVDAQAKQPVESFVVQKGWLSGPWETIRPCYHAGTYERSVPTPPRDDAYRYRVLAEGYETAVSDPVKHEEGEVTVNFELKRAEAEPEKVTETKEPPAAAIGGGGSDVLAVLAAT